MKNRRFRRHLLDGFSRIEEAESDGGSGENQESAASTTTAWTMTLTLMIIIACLDGLGNSFL
jgi:hypothetical protein